MRTLNMLSCWYQLVFFIIATTAVLADVKGYRDEKDQGTIVAQLERHGFKTLLQHLGEANLTATLSSVVGGPYTLFAPTDEAFQALNPDTTLAMAARGWAVLLRHHIVRQIITESNIQHGASFNNTLQLAYVLNLDVNNKVASVNSQSQIIGKIEAENGIIYPIDKVIIHNVPEVLIVMDNDINGALTTFEKAIAVAGLTSMLEDPNKLFTVFAPTDKAMNKLGNNVLKDLFSHPEKLRKFILDKLVVSGLYFVKNLSTKDFLTTIGGERLNIKQILGTIISPDRFTSNGVDHAVDQVPETTSNTGYSNKYY